VYKNSTVPIRSKSVAGENYVELDPGDPSRGALRSGGVLPLSQELAPTQDDDVFSIFNAPERKNLARLQLPISRSNFPTIVQGPADPPYGNGRVGARAQPKQ
jgi:ABC-type transporter Mla subunit MlaD